jgi:hypothetical protein
MAFDIKQIWDFLNLGVDITANKTMKVKIGPVTIDGISIEHFKDLRKDEIHASQILKRIFVDKEIMWQDLTRERTSLIIKSMEDLQTYCDTEVNNFIAREKKQDKLFIQLLQLLSSICLTYKKKCLRHIEACGEINRTALTNEDMMEPEEFIAEDLLEFRREALPIANVFIATLPDNNLIRTKAIERFNTALDILIKRLNLPANEKLDALVELV